MSECNPQDRNPDVRAQLLELYTRLAQVIFQEADIATLPLPDTSADIVISNGAINLATNKDAVLGEAFRILRHGGRLQIADMVRDPSGTDSSCTEKASWADCVSGEGYATKYRVDKNGGSSSLSITIVGTRKEIPATFEFSCQ